MSKPLRSPDEQRKAGPEPEGMSNTEKVSSSRAVHAPGCAVTLATHVRCFMLAMLCKCVILGSCWGGRRRKRSRKGGKNVRVLSMAEMKKGEFDCPKFYDFGEHDGDESPPTSGGERYFGK